MRTYPEFECRPVKHHGCICPFHPYQISAYVVLLYQFLVTFLCMGPAVDPTSRTVFLTVSGLLQLTVAVLGLLATKSDPTDPIVYAFRKAVTTK